MLAPWTAHICILFYSDPLIWKYTSLGTHQALISQYMHMLDLSCFCLCCTWQVVCFTMWQDLPGMSESMDVHILATLTGLLGAWMYGVQGFMWYQELTSQVSVSLVSRSSFMYTTCAWMHACMFPCPMHGLFLMLARPSDVYMDRMIPCYGIERWKHTWSMPS